MRQIVQKIKAEAIVERVKTNSVLNPLLWLCGITALIFSPEAYFSIGYAKAFFCFMAAAPVVAALIAYFIFMFKDPNRLQSEEYQIAQQIIMQGSKEEDNLSLISQTSAHALKAYSDEDLSKPDDLPPASIRDASVYHGEE